MTSPLGSSPAAPVSFTVVTVKVAEVSPASSVTVCSPSSSSATKSLAAASATDRFTVRFAAGAVSALTVNEAVPPPVTAAPPVMVSSGGGGTASTTNTGDRP